MKEINQNDLPELLSPLGGGFYCGLLRFGENPQAYALIVAPKAEGEITDKEWGAYGEKIEGDDSICDGLANTRAMAEAGSELAAWALGLRIGGFDDWHIPARDQLELLYRHCKPTDEENDCSFRDGENLSSIPLGFAYTDAAPAQCANTLFQAGGAEAFDDRWYWASTQYSAYYAWVQSFDVGYQDVNNKGNEGRARAVRLIRVIH